MSEEGLEDVIVESYLDVARKKGAEAFIVTGPGQDREWFNVREVATRHPKTVDEVLAILSAEDEKARPELTPRSMDLEYGEPVCEMVPLDKVVGGWNYPEPRTWLVDEPGQEREHRGVPRILELIEKFEGGEGFSPNSPIRVEKHGNEYYVGADGRHRVAALKAMGVPELPMVVTEAKRREVKE